MRFYFFVIMLFTVAAFADSNQINLVQALEQDFQQGKLSQAEYIAFQFYGKTQPEKLPAAYQGLQTPFSRKGTLLLQQAGQLLQSASGEDKALLSSMFSRPNSEKLPDKLISPSGRFKIHYTTSGRDASEYDFVELAAEEFDKAYELICGELGYDDPPDDQGVDGPEWDVYMHSIGDYGYSTAENPAATNEHPYGATSYIDIDNDFATTYTEPKDALRVTVMHEFFHMVQIGYRSYLATSQNAVWFFETSAVWMEERSYPEVNDYIQYLPNYFINSDKSLYIADGLHEYGSGLFFIMLQLKYGDDIIRHVWEEFANTEAIDALATVLQEKYATSLSMELFDHAALNYVSSLGFDDFYPDYEYFPHFTPKQTALYPENFFVEYTAPKLSYFINEVTFKDTLAIEILPDFDSNDEWAFIAVKTGDTYEPQVFKSMGKSSCFINQLLPSDKLVVIPVNIKVPQYPDMSKNTFSFEIQERLPIDVESSISKIFPNPFMPERHHVDMTAQVVLANEAEIKAVITNENGRIVYEQEMGTFPQGVFNFHWDGQDADNHPLPSGIYILHIFGDEHIAPKKFAIIR